MEQYGGLVFLRCRSTHRGFIQELLKGVTNNSRATARRLGLPVWSGHFCPLPLTLTLILGLDLTLVFHFVFDFVRINTTVNASVEERRFQRRVSQTERNRASAPALKKLPQPFLNFRPLRLSNRIPHRIAWHKIRGHAMGAKNPFKLPADAFKRCSRPLIARVRVKADAKHLPAFKGMRQHEQLSLGVRRTADGRAGEPCVANLTSVGIRASVARMSRRPRPSLHVPKSRRADNQTVIHVDDCERHSGAVIAPCQRRIDVSGGLRFALWNRTPPVECRISFRRGRQALGVMVIQWFEANVVACKSWRAVHSFSIRCRRRHRNRCCQQLRGLSFRPKSERQRRRSGGTCCSLVHRDSPCRADASAALTLILPLT